MEAKGPGKTAPRLIADLLEYDPRHVRSHTKNLLTEPAQIFRGTALRRRTSKDCRHELIRKDETTQAPISEDEQPDSSTRYLVKTFCTRCWHHFKISVDFRAWRQGQEPCRLSNPERPLHHLRHVLSKDGKLPHMVQNENKYSRFLEAHRFECTSQRCPLIVEVIVTQPRLSDELVAPIFNPITLQERGQRCISQEPGRFAGSVPLTPVQAVNNLRAYIFAARQNARASEPPRRIQARNKLFALTFSTDCDKLLEYMDFVTLEERDPESQSADLIKYWVPPTVNASNDDFIYDIYVELSCLMAARPREEYDPNQRVPFNPIPARKDIERSLGYSGYPTKSRSINLTGGEEHPYYASLGTIDSFNDELLGWAYDRQRICDPKNKPYYLDCMRDLAKGRNSSDLQVKAALAVSQGEIGLSEIEAAYNSLGIDPYTTEGDEYVIGVYKSRIEAAPRQKGEARQAIALIGRIRQSAKISAIANEHTMSYEEALEFLSISADTDSDSIEAVAIAMSQDADKVSVARALKVIAAQRDDDYTLHRAAATMESGAGDLTLDVGEAYNRLQIRERHVPDETVLSYYQSLAGVTNAGSADIYTEALRVIALDRGSRFLLRKLDDPNADIQAEPANASQPVGLGNIGNTCYLNSLLQYLYTVRAVRNMVLDFPSYRMELTDVNIKRKKIGEEQKTKQRIVRAQRFVEELMTLFEHLKKASTSSIVPTKQLAELTLLKADKEDELRRGSISSPHTVPGLPMANAAFGPAGPSLPAGSVNLGIIDEDIEMIEHSDAAPVGSADASSPSSSTTLVDPDLTPPYGKTQNKSEVSVAEKNRESSNGDVPSETMSTDPSQQDVLPINGQNDIVGQKAVPPVPPRNKANLSIQTPRRNNQESRADGNALMNFGAQQDVTEVIGNVIDQLRSAIRATGIDQIKGEQLDEVRDTFYGDIVSVRPKSRVIESWSTLMSYPHLRFPRNIYEALDVVFDEDMELNEGQLQPRYASLISLPPILQIQIQRTVYDKNSSTSGKNQTPVTFPETLYMDRYMDASPESPLLRRRRETWTWKKELAQLEARADALRSTSPEDGNITVTDALSATAEYVSAISSEPHATGLTISPELPKLLASRTSEIGAELSLLDSRMAILKQKLSEQFTDLVQEQYKLHSVFIHRGQDAAGGHYWIYIYDFINDIWREYNDEYVSIVHDRRRIFETKGFADGTPYYLTYVRSKEKTDLVDAVCREVSLEEPEGVMQQQQGSWGGNGKPANVDVEMGLTNGVVELDGTETQVRGGGEDKILVSGPQPN